MEKSTAQPEEMQSPGVCRDESEPAIQTAKSSPEQLDTPQDWDDEACFIRSYN